MDLEGADDSSSAPQARGIPADVAAAASVPAAAPASASPSAADAAAASEKSATEQPLNEGTKVCLALPQELVMRKGSFENT